MANYYGKKQRARGRAGTCPCEKTIRARGEVCLSLGTYDLQMSCPLLTLHRMEYCFRGVWEAASASLVLIHSYP